MSRFLPALKQAAVILVLAVPPAAATALWHPLSPSTERDTDAQQQRATLAEGEVTLSDVLSWTSPPFWIDARSTTRYGDGHIPGAWPLNEDEWENQLFDVLAALPTEARIVVYCDGEGCDASHAVAGRLRKEAELGEVYVLHGGWDSWKAAER